MSLHNDIAMAVVRTAPPVAVIWAAVAGWGPQQWMYAATFVYVVMQIVHLAWRWAREARRGKHETR